MTAKARRGAIPAGHGGRYEGYRREKAPLYLNLIGEALYSIQTHIIECQEQLTQEVRRLNEENGCQ